MKRRRPHLGRCRGIAAKVLCAIWLCAATDGCAPGRLPAQSQPPHDNTARDDAFAKGADRQPTPQTLYAMSRILASQGRDADCQVLLARVVRQWPQFLPAYSALAESQMRARRVDEAILTLTAGLRVSPGDPVLLNDIGMCHLVKQEFPAALVRFTSAAAAAPSDSRYRANMATALGLMGRYDESLALYSQVLSSADAHYNLAILCQARHDSARAAEEFRQADALRRAQSLGPPEDGAVAQPAPLESGSSAGAADVK